ncbi:protein disulfide isomerase [Pelomyxa schiedti]|nr:protein disulfide isomerase [Pelomyxa schiedti]
MVLAFAVALAVVIVLAPACFVVDASRSVPITTLTPPIIEEVLTKGDYNLHVVLFTLLYRRSCSECEEMYTQFQRARGLLGMADPPVDMHIFDGLAEGAAVVSAKYNIASFPVIKGYVSGLEVFTYNGPITADAIASFILSMNGPAAKEINSVKTLKKLIAEKDKVFTVGIFEAEANSAGFLLAAQTLRKLYSFYIIKDPQLISKLVSEEQYPPQGIITYRHYASDTPFEVFKLDVQNVQQISAFVRGTSLPLASVYEPSIERWYSEMPRFTVYTTVSNSKSVELLLSQMREVAQQFVGQLAFVIMDKSVSEYTQFKFASKAPVMSIVDTKNHLLYKPESPAFSVDSATAYASKYVQGHLQRYIQSEPIPARKNLVIQDIVALNYKEEVLEAPEDILIQIYYPDCIPCQKFLPTFIQLANRLSPLRQTLKIAQYNSVENEPQPGYKVTGFPTICIIRADNKEHITYSGPPDVDTLEQWVLSSIFHKPPKPEL